VSAATSVAFALIGVGAVATLVRLLIGPTLADRIVASDLLLVMVMAGGAVQTARTGSRTYLVVMLVVAVVGFLGTAAVARYIERRGP
jgi:multicomponent Na+:H+ antiporter subunit F